MTRGQGSLTIVPESPGELIMLIFRVKKERAPHKFLKAFYDGSLPFCKTRKMKLLCTHRWLWPQIKYSLVIKGSQFLRDILRPLLTRRRKRGIWDSFGQKPNETLEVWLHQPKEEKATTVLLDEREWKSIPHLRTDPMLLATLAKNSITDNISTEEEVKTDP